MRIKSPSLKTESDIQAEIYHMMKHHDQLEDEGLKKGVKIFIRELFKEKKSINDRNIRDSCKTEKHSYER